MYPGKVPGHSIFYQLAPDFFILVQVQRSIERPVEGSVIEVIENKAEPKTFAEPFAQIISDGSDGDDAV